MLLCLEINADKIIKLVIRAVMLRIDQIEQTGRDLPFFQALGDAETAALLMFCRVQRAGIVCTGTVRT